VATYARSRAVALPRAALHASSIARRCPVIAILALQALVSVLALHNTAFQDEALYLYAGRQVIHHWGGGPPPLADYAFYFSGYPYVYPVVGGFLDMIGGLELARGFSVACMLGVTTIVYLMTLRLFGQRSAVFASAVYASAGEVVFVGRLATYDALCLFLIALAAGLAVRGGMSRRPWAVLPIGPLVVLAILAKYAALLLVLPVFTLLACVCIPFLGWWRAIRRLSLATASFALGLGVAYLIMDKSAFHAISGSTTNRAVGFRAPRLDLLNHVLLMGGVIYLVAIGGLMLAFRLRWRFRIIAVLLFGSSLLMPAYHVYTQEPISLDKHIAYALFFAAPLAGDALGWLSGGARESLLRWQRGYWLGGRWLASLSVVLAIFTLGLGQARYLYGGWPNTSALTTALHSQLRDGSGRILAEDIEVSTFDAMDVTEPWQWGSFYYPYYVDHAGHQLYGPAATSQAIKDRYYNWVELSFIYLPQDAYYAAGQMAQTRNYDLIAAVLFSDVYGKGHFFLFRSALVAGHGNFRSLAQLTKVSWVS
jgi:4-amino-4-deoxy-L-arabinose transferase-like glycosyltransferase